MSQQIKIAIIEDEKSIREMYTFKLASQGYHVKSAEDGLSGFELVKEYRPQLILLDIKMPKLPGNEVLKRVRSEIWGRYIKVIILTNVSKHEIPADLRFLRVDKYIIKAHYTPRQVLEIVNEVLESK